MLIIKNAFIINGDGRTPPFTGSVLVDDATIAAVVPQDISGGPDDQVIDAHGRAVLPGAIDAHAHAVAPGPRFASGTPGVSEPECLGNLRRHLAQGHTTVVDLDGFKVPSETERARSCQPVKVESATVHFEPMFEAADAADGSGLSTEHREMTAEQMADQGAVVIGEVGAGMTLGGGGQDYMYIPAAIKDATGETIDALQAQSLKYAVLGRHIRPGQPDRDRLQTLITELGLPDITVDEVIAVIEKSVLPSFQVALDGLVRSATVAKQLGIPTLVHNSAPSDEAAREAAKVAGPLFIGGHTNHGTFSPDECVSNARAVRQSGGFVEIDTFDSWGRRTLHNTPEHLIALVQEDLVDIIATDYAAGHWDGMWQMVSAIVQVGLTTPQRAVAMATGNVARAIPRIGQSRGVVAPGLSADLVIADPNHLADIAMVLIDGRVVLRSPDRPTVEQA